MPDCQSGAVHSLGCGTIIGIAVASEHSVFVTPIVTRGKAAKARVSRAAAVVGAPVSFLEKRRAQVGARFGQADTLLQGSEVLCSWRTRTISLESIHHRGGDRASCRTLIAFGRTTAGSGVTLKVGATWVLLTAALRGFFLSPA